MSTSTSSTTLPAGQLSDAELWDVDYVNQDHLKAFERALSMSDTGPIEGDVSPASPRSPPLGLSHEGAGGSSSSHHRSSNQTWKYGPDNGALLGGDLSGPDERGRERIEKLTATSDFAPIHQKVLRRPSVASQGLTYHLMRWPLLGIIFTIIYFEFGAYVVIRQIVNAFEWLVAWRGHKQSLRQEMRKAKTYEEWIETAKKLDKYLGFDEWKGVEEDSYFDYLLVRRVRRTLTRLRAAKDTRGLMDALAVCVRSNFAGTESVKMYSEASDQRRGKSNADWQTFYGTKKVVETHVEQVAASLDQIRLSSDVSNEEKRAFFRAINKNYGSSALCLSGGASFGYYHFGVIKAFLDADLLPRVITGTSAGGLVAALLCTRTNDELKQLIVPRLADKITACSDSITVWFKRFLKTGARFSSTEWAAKAMFFTKGSLTFKEAYERTGRALNVSVVPADRHSPTILLNHLTAPNCLIWSAILASAAVPGIMNPVVLMAKDRTGQIKPHNLGGSRFKDGSLREDIPLGSLHTQFNCNFSIVSQTNPHIHLFFFAPRGSVGRPVAHRKGKGWRGGFILSALESYIKLDLTKHFKVIRDLDLLPQLLQSDWSGVFLQRFSGDLTLTPRSTLGDWRRILSDPNRQQLTRMIDVGQRVTWPALRMVHNRMMIERAILRGRTEVRQALNRDRTTIDNTDGRDSDRQIEGMPGNAQVPIESDADAGFAMRSKRIRSRPGMSNAARTAEMISQGHPLRNRRLSAARRQHVAQPQPQQQSVQFPSSAPAGPSAPPPVPTGAPPAYTPSNGFSDTLRHVRSLSSTAFTSPFRRSAPDQASPEPERERDRDPARRRSQRSISRWFGGGGASDSSEEEDDQAELGSGARDEEGEDTPRFSLHEAEEGALVDEPDSDQEDEIAEAVAEAVPMMGDVVGAATGLGLRAAPANDAAGEATVGAGDPPVASRLRRRGVGFETPRQDGA